MADEKDPLKALAKASPEKRVEELRKMLSSKKKEMGEIEALFGRSIKELSNLRERNTEAQEAEEESLDRVLEREPGREQPAPQAPAQEESPVPLESAVRLYERMRSYSEMAREGIMDYQAFNAAVGIYQQIKEMAEYAPKDVTNPENAYLTQKNVEEISSSMQRLMREISGEYIAETKFYKGPEL